MLDFVPDSYEVLSSKAVSGPHVYQIRKYKVPKSVEHVQKQLLLYSLVRFCSVFLRLSYTYKPQIPHTEFVDC